ncbi:MAG: putative tail tape measure protein [Prokaryotic dsDNA virus sp.]|jgi:tape measure domain-containing protein|nr:hypothetical protein [Flavobacteriaceae bacterium]QDP65281.1 MAG: putative tail tape measure protein [Prokaryotic dsDNA virus sp.]|tara:strand:+ start:26736 stop:29900 length:3165 start_codon:yes stop_codon:yes gene_type:complete
MVTENVNIRFRESGARVIKRRIDEIGKAANNATRGIFLLQRALFVIGGAGIARGLQRYADALTNVENRLRLTTSSTANLEAAQSQLFDVARRSRSSFQATADVYNRIALSARNLGVGQKQILDVTETLQKAAIISGASAREANAALIQLGQGIASDRLSGDELRSVLEQLPAVADIIVDYLNETQQFGTVTRGTLRELGREGKLTSELIFRAIQSSKSDIDKLFAETQPTIEQAFNVAKTNFLEFLDAFDDATGASAAIANLIIKISENFDVLLTVIGGVAAALAGLFASKVIRSFTSFIAKLRISGGALARLRALQVAYTKAQVASTAAVVNDTRARVANLQQMTARSAAQVRAAQIEYAEAAAAFQNGRARDALTGRFISNAAARDRLTAASIRLANAERVNLGLTTKLTAARTAAAAADNAAAAAATRATAARAAQGGVLTRLSATFPTLAGGARLAGGAVRGLFALLAANPIGAVVTAIGLAVAALFTFGDRIKVTEDGVVSLKDAAIAAFQLIVEAVAPVGRYIRDSLGSAFSFIGEKFNEVGKSIKDFVVRSIEIIFDAFTAVPRFIAGVVAGIIAVWDQLPLALGYIVDQITDFFATGFENIANLGIEAVNEIIRGFNLIADTAVGEKLGLTVKDTLDPVTLDNLRTNFGAGGKEVGEAFTEAFTSTFEGGRVRNVLSRFGDAVIKRARQNIANEEIGTITDSELPPSIPPGSDDGGGSGSGGGTSANFASELSAIQDKIELERMYGVQKEITNNILSIEKNLKRELSEVEAQQVAEATRLLEISKIQGEVLQEILGPQETLRFTQSALNELFAEGAITLEQYNTKLRETQIAADRAANTLGGGFRAAIASSIQSAGQFGETLGNFVVGAAGKAADAIVEFAKTGQFNIRAFFQDLFAQLLRLAAQRLLLQFIGGFLGIPGAGLTGVSGGGTIPGARLGGSILPSFAGGGSLSPTGPGSTDTEIVAFNKRPDERVDILTPGQQAAQNRRLNGMDGTQAAPVVNSTTNVAAVISPSDIVGAFDNSEGETVVVNMIQRNASTIRQIVQG